MWHEVWCDATDVALSVRLFAKSFVVIGKPLPFRLQIWNWEQLLAPAVSLKPPKTVQIQGAQCAKCLPEKKLTGLTHREPNVWSLQVFSSMVFSHLEFPTTLEKRCRSALPGSHRFLLNTCDKFPWVQYVHHPFSPACWMIYTDGPPLQDMVHPLWQLWSQSWKAHVLLDHDSHQSSKLFKEMATFSIALWKDSGALS